MWMRATTLLRGVLTSLQVRPESAARGSGMILVLLAVTSGPVGTPAFVMMELNTTVEGSHMMQQASTQRHKACTHIDETHIGQQDIGERWCYDSQELIKGRAIAPAQLRPNSSESKEGCSPATQGLTACVGPSIPISASKARAISTYSGWQRHPAGHDCTWLRS